MEGSPNTEITTAEKPQEENPLRQQFLAIRQVAADRTQTLELHMQMTSTLSEEEKTHALMQEACEGIKAIVDDYDSFKAGIGKDKQLKAELYQSFEQNLKEELSKSELSDPKVIQTFELMRRFVERDDSFSEVNIISELTNLSRDLPSALSSAVVDGKYYTLNSSTFSIVNRLVRQDMRRLFDLLANQLSESDTQEFIKIAQKAIDPEFGTRAQYDAMGDPIFNRPERESLAESLIHTDTSTSYSFYANKNWEITRSSKQVKEIFGEIVEDLDQKILNDLLIKSLGPRPEMQMVFNLGIYSTPESIRNLILLSIGTQVKGKDFYAFNTLKKLAKKPGWAEAVAKAESVYPDLINCREILLDLDSINVSILRENAKEFVNGLSKGNNDDSTENILLEQRCLEALTADKLLENTFVINHFKLTEIDQRLLQQAIQVLVHKQLAEYKEKKTSPRNFSELSEHIRSLALNTLFEGIEDVDTSAMIKIAQIIITTDNADALEFLSSNELRRIIEIDQIGIDVIKKIVDSLPGLLPAKMSESRSFIINNASLFLATESDIKFVNILIGKHGQKVIGLIRGYKECIDSGVVSAADYDLIIELTDEFRVLSPSLMKGYKLAKESGTAQAYIAELKSMAEKMVSTEKFDNSEREKPYYLDLIKHVYPNNGGNWGNYQEIAGCSDRSKDLDGFKIEKRYDLDLLSQGKIRVKDGEEIDTQVLEVVQRPIYEIADKLKAGKENGSEELLSQLLEQMVISIQSKGGLSEIKIDGLHTNEERLFVILADSNFGTRSVDTSLLKQAVILYQFTKFADIAQYINGTRDKMSLSENPEYTLLCAVEEFYADAIKEVNRTLVQSAWENQAVQKLMSKYFNELSSQMRSTQRQDERNRLQIDKLGLAPGFIRQIGRILEKKNNRKYTDDEIKEIIHRYESFTQGLSEKATSSPKVATKTFYGMLRGQREKTFSAIEKVTGEKIDPSQIHMGEINLQEQMDVEHDIFEGTYDSEQFAVYTAQKFIDLFNYEQTLIQRELNKFVSEQGTKREIIHSYITKTKESAYARMVGGVCVAVDNPAEGIRVDNIWDMPNYFQLVLQDPSTLSCVGLVLLHSIENQGEKILSASFNPSSTYLATVDEQALYKSLVETLGKFATDNNYDRIVTSQNRTIRTNRTGGLFEQAIQASIDSLDKPVRFVTPQQFSFHPNYTLQDMDTVWEKLPLAQ